MLGRLSWKAVDAPDQTCTLCFFVPGCKKKVYENVTFGEAQHLRIADEEGMFDRTVTLCSASKLFSLTGEGSSAGQGRAGLTCGGGTVSCVFFMFTYFPPRSSALLQSGEVCCKRHGTAGSALAGMLPPVPTLLAARGKDTPRYHH